MSDAVIAAKDVGRVYASDSGDIHALRDINFEVRRGEFVALRGRSGSGKTTLLNCIGGLDNPTSGVIWIQGPTSPRWKRSSAPAGGAKASASSSSRWACCRAFPPTKTLM